MVISRCENGLKFGSAFYIKMGELHLTYTKFYRAIAILVQAASGRSYSEALRWKVSALREKTALQFELDLRVTHSVLTNFFVDLSNKSKYEIVSF